MIPGTSGAAESAATAKLLAVSRLRDPQLADHGVRTAHIASAVAADLGLSTADVDQVYLGGLLHDIGKLGITEAVLWKPSGLDSSEWKQIRCHPEGGHRLVADVVGREVSACVLYHHERVDGEGYPYGIDSRSLPIAVRIVQVADAFDAMTSDRPYEAALPPSTAVAELRRCAGTQFDTETVDALDRLLGAAFQPEVSLPSLNSVMPPDPFSVASGAEI